MKFTKMSELHNFSLEMLDSFDDLCSRHCLRYYLAYGALLGYARHNALIPWDDDIDVIMTREDYEKLLSIPPEEIDSGYRLEKIRDKDYFFDFVTRYVSNNNSVERKDVTDCEGKQILENVGMDIFVLDKSFTGKKQTDLVRKLKFTYLQTTKYRKIKTSSSTTVRILKKIAGLSAVNRSLLDLIERYDSISKSCDVDTGKVYTSNAAPADIHQEFDSEWFDNPTKISLMGHTYPAPSDIDGFLKICYGDYMELPPENKRITQHYLLELDE